APGTVMRPSAVAACSTAAIAVAGVDSASGKKTSTGRAERVESSPLGMRAPMPLPSPVRLVAIREFLRVGGVSASDLRGRLAVRQRPCRAEVVADHALSVAGRLGHAHGSGNDRRERLGGEVVAYLLGYLLSEIGA